MPKSCPKSVQRAKYTGGVGKRPREFFTADEILAWMDKVAAVPQTETAAKLHISRNTVRAYQDKVGEFIAQDFDINAYRMPFYTLWPEIMASVRANLEKHDVAMTVALCKGLQIFVDKQVNENNDKLDSLSNDELTELVNRRIGLTQK